MCIKQIYEVVTKKDIRVLFEDEKAASSYVDALNKASKSGNDAYYHPVQLQTTTDHIEVTKAVLNEMVELIANNLYNFDDETDSLDSSELCIAAFDRLLNDIQNILRISTAMLSHADKKDIHSTAHQIELEILRAINAERMYIFSFNYGFNRELYDTIKSIMKTVELDNPKVLLNVCIIIQHILTMYNNDLTEFHMVTPEDDITFKCTRLDRVFNSIRCYVNLYNPKIELNIEDNVLDICDGANTFTFTAIRK